MRMKIIGVFCFWFDLYGRNLYTWWAIRSNTLKNLNLINIHPQKMDVLVDTGSAGMGVPIAKPANWSEPSFVALDAKAAGAEIIACQDPRCR